MLIKPDINAGRRDYREVPSDALRVSKIFPTIQGEGPLAGQFAVFVRLAGCNLGAKIQCPWCDTDFRLSHSQQMLVSDILRECENVREYRPKTMVLTGGEPFLQNPHLFIRRACDTGWTVQVETNGYFYSEELSQVMGEYPHRFLIVVSPKVNVRWQFPEPELQLIADACAFKFVVDASPTSPYHELPGYAQAIAQSGKPVYISPLNIYKRDANPREVRPSFWGDDSPLDLERCRENHKYAAAMALRRGWQLNVQTHLLGELE